MKTQIIFKKKKSDGKVYYAYLKSKSPDGKPALKSLEKSFPLKEVNWGGRSPKKMEILRLKGEYINSNNPNYVEINEELKTSLNNAVPYEELSDLAKLNVFAFLQNEIDQMLVNKKYGNRNSYITLKKDLLDYQKYRGKTDLMFPHITTQYVIEFEQYLTGVRKLAKSTTSVRMYKFKAIYELAIEKDVYKPTKNVFYKRKFAGSKSEKEFLNVKEVEKLLVCRPLKNPVRGYYQDFDENGCLKMQQVEIARLMFIFCIFSSGMRVSDILFLRWNNLNFRDNPQIDYTMYKTKTRIKFNLTSNLIWVLQYFVNSNDRFEDEIRPEEIVCPRCASKNLMKGGTNRNSKGMIPTLKCLDCSRKFQNPPREVREPVELTDLLHYDLMNFSEGARVPSEYYRSANGTREFLPIKTNLIEILKKHGNVYFNELNQEILDIESLLSSESNISARVFYDLLKANRVSVEGYENNDLYVACQTFFDKESRRDLVNIITKFKRDENSLKEFETQKLAYVHYLSTLENLKAHYVQTKNKNLLSIFEKYSNEKPNSFIFPMLKDKDFADVDGKNDFHLVSEQQYIMYQSKSKRYNELLKKVEKHLGLKISISTHTARYTFTYLMVDKDFDVYTISRLLGHSSISITDRYLPRFLEAKANKSMASLNDSYNIDDINKKESEKNRSVAKTIEYSRNLL